MNHRTGVEGGDTGDWEEGKEEGRKIKGRSEGYMYGGRGDRGS